VSRGRFAIVAAGAVFMLGAAAPAALAARVIVLGAGGHASVRNDRFLTALTPTPALPASAARAVPRAHIADRNVRTELARLRRRHAISQADYRRYLGSFNRALGAVRRLRGTRASELESVIQTLHAIAADGLLIPSRLPALFLTLDRNRTWWSTGPLLSFGQRVEFAGSDVVWEYYPGQGIQLQQLGSFGKADGLYSAGPSSYARMLHLLSELIPLAVKRAGGLTWEYYFTFDGGTPPWTSAMSQGTAIEALTRAYQATGNRAYLDVAHRALPVLSAAPPVGVSVRTALGRRYLLYSFAPGAAVINGFLQTLIGLFDYAQVSGDGQAATLFAAGNAEALVEVPRYDTGAWSLYELGQEDTLDYHTLVTGFLQQLCARVQAPVYCTTAAHFQSYLKTPPTLTLLTHRARAGAPATIRFALSKVSHVGIVVVHGGQTVFLTSAQFAYGVNAFTLPTLNQPGTYTIRLAATDLASNFNRIVSTLEVSG
jgi:hypothetical protein